MTLNIQNEVDTYDRFGFLTPWEEDFLSGIWKGDETSTTTLAVGGGYVGAPVTSPGSGYVGVQTVNAPTGNTGFAAWLEQNKTAVYAGAGVLALMAMFGRRR